VIVDTVDAELDRLISRRASQDTRPDPDELEPGYVESVLRFNARRREENRRAWADFHEGQAARLRAVLEGLITRHEEQAERYRDQPKGVA
jgi:hypothetical protein